MGKTLFLSVLRKVTEKAKKATFKGDRKIFDAIRGGVVNFDIFFEVIPGTNKDNLKAKDTKAMQVQPGTIDANID